jgi:hypothetical protein
MRNITTIFIVLLYSTISFAQNKQFVELKDGTIIEGNVERVQKIFQKGKLIVNDSTEILLQNVYRFQSSDGYFIRMNQGFGDTWAERIIHGNIDLYTRTVKSYNGGTWMPTGAPGGGSFYVGGGSSSSQVEYFSKNDGPLMKANAFNLKKHLNDNPISMEYLKKRDGLTAVQWIGAIAGIAIAGITISNQLDKDELDVTGPVIGMGIFAGSVWIPYFEKRNLVQKAINEYNNPRLRSE